MVVFLSQKFVLIPYKKVKQNSAVFPMISSDIILGQYIPLYKKAYINPKQYQWRLLEQIKKSAFHIALTWTYFIILQTKIVV